MKQRKPRGFPPRPGRKRKDLTDISPSTSLPPLVEGQLRCFLKLTVSKILWTVSKPPASFLVRVRWWGETSNGTIFVPRDTSQMEQKTLKTTTRYPVRCGPKQFASYLTDMGALILEVMTKSDHLPIGQVQIGGLARLAPGHPISGFFTIVSPASEKMGELQVSLVLEPLSETYDSSSSIPNTGVSFSVGLPAQGAKEAAEAAPLLAPPQIQKPSSTSVSGRESVSSSRASTPRGKDHLYFHENSENVGPNHPKPRSLFPSNSDCDAEVRLLGGSRNPARVLSCNNPATKDLLSALLDQGSRLREAMVVSAMKSSPDSGIELYDTHPSLKQETTKLAGKNLKNLNLGLPSTVEDPLQPPADDSEFDLQAEDRAIHLLLNSSDLSPVRLLDGSGSPPESLSLGSDVYDSELNDPHYDQSLLENLFYTAQKSDSSLSDFLSEEEDVISSGKQNLSRRSKPLTALKTLGSSPSGQKEKTPGTETSHSAGPLPPHETSVASTEEMQAVNLSLDRLAVLSQIHLARVVIESLGISPEEIIGNTQGKKTSVGKPPRPIREKKSTFFLEYNFPVGASKNGTGQVAVTTERVRVASSKIAGEVVKFQQRHVYPVHFSGSMITHWCNANLEFNIFLKKGTERKPLLIGSAALPLREVIQSEQLTIIHKLPVKAEGGPARLGPLKVSLELVADNKDFTSANSRAARVPKQVPPLYAVRSPGVKRQDSSKTPTPAESPRLLKQSNRESSKRTQETPGRPSMAVNPPLSVPLPVSRNLLTQRAASEEEALLLHVLLMVPEGEVSAPREAGLLGSCNVYLNCKLFNSDEATRSAIMWGTTKPAFRFSQVTPISLTSKHLERLKNNVMVLEAWNKGPSPGGDRLLGLVKLPLHQFYVSFRDPKISHLLLQAQYPVLAVDGPMPLVEVFSGNRSGTLKVILAMGSADQIVALQRLKDEEGRGPPVALRPPHSLDPLATPLPKQGVQGKESLMEHVFEIHVESARGLAPLQSTVWGEADCYVQYHFPVQESESDVPGGPEFCEKGLRLRPYRSATTLCVPDPTFNEECRHSLLVPAEVPVQRLLLSAFSAQGLAGGGGIVFEIWCRYYYPNVRDQMVARGTLPLSRLCALVTLQHREEVGVQTFSLPLVPRTESSGEPHPRPSGFLDVSIRYGRCLKITEGVLAAQTVSLSVQIHFAAGLQAAARALAEKNPSLQYSAEVGVNAYVSVHLPFLPETERRNTRPVARTFCPEFEHHVEFPCRLAIQRSSGEACCLAELLHLSEIIFSVFHRSLNSASHATTPQASRDYLLGTVKVPTRDLLLRRSGIRGWYPVTLPEDLMPSHCANIMQSVAGGLELSVGFVHPEDRERVLDAAKLLGWNWDDAEPERLEDDSEGEYQPVQNLTAVTVSIPRLWLPLQSVLLAGETQINRRVYCYLRYKLYDQEATWTSLRKPRLAEDQKQVTVTYKKSKQMGLPQSQALQWYFREERLEFQVWRAFGNESNVERPLDTDRLIGSAYVDLSGLSKSSGKKRTVSGVFPLFRRNASNLSGAAVRVHIAVSSAGVDGLEGESRGDSSASECEEPKKAPEPDVELHLEPSPSASEILAKKSEESPPAVDHEKTFAASILVERAMHLSLKGSPLTERGVTVPSSYVSFVAADADNLITTEVVENTESPVWGFQRQTRLSKELLLDPQQTLVFKVWHKADVERVIGFASVDLSPLLSGFHLVCGWYNITDFSGQCQGQIKVAISPLENIAHLKEERQARSQMKTPGCSVPATNPSFQARGFYSAFPSFSTKGTEQLFNSSSKGFDAASHEKAGSSGSWMPRHEEHVQNIRRFHESLQQAEGSAQQARALDSRSYSSRSSLLRTLRKNLSELDEIQSYFRQKLIRPFPGSGAGQTGIADPGSGHRGTATRAVSPEGHQLLEKSNRLVSQVSSLITDLQNKIMKDAEESPGACVDRSRRLSANEPLLDLKESPSRTETLQGHLRNQTLHAGVDEVPVSPLGKSFHGRDVLYEFLDQAESRGDPYLSAHGIRREEEGAQSHSEEEYDEDVIEPRTLNEITPVTDRTSPWSSPVSELEREAIGRAAEYGLQEPGTRSSSMASITQEDPQSIPSPARSRSISPFLEAVDEEPVERHGFEGSTGEPSQPSFLLLADQAEGGPAEEDQGESQEEPPETEGKTADGQSFLLCHGAKEVLPAETLVPESKKGEEHLHDHYQDEEALDSSKEEVPRCPDSLQAAQHTTSGSTESCEDSPEERRNVAKPSVVLSDPVLVPNFFLPPEHLEASMRLLGVSSSPAPAWAGASQPGSGDGGAGAAAPTAGIPFRRQNRPKANLMPAELPEEETKRIARIFSSRFSKKT
uniref:C2 domain-containing protein 3 n=1 Tax=Pogona vitticeps TaxID=103695 RepID=A0ABM5FVV2_9SAUR